MRYLRPGEFDETTIGVAEELFERFVGRRLTVELYDERLPVVRDTCVLTHTPIMRIESIKTTCSNYDYASILGPVSSVIDVKTVSEREGRVSLPLSLFGTHYSSANVAYLAGYDPVPGEVIDTVREIAQGVRDGTLTEWSGPEALSEQAQQTLMRYRRGGERSSRT